jgi:hypothetical protein
VRQQSRQSLLYPAPLLGFGVESGSEVANRRVAIDPGWNRLERRWAAQQSPSRLRHGASRKGDMLTIGELAWSGYDIGGEVGIRVVSRQFELTPGKPLRFFADGAAKKWPLRGSLNLTVETL